ncbi:uncharacterized protein obi1 [Brachyhypopomus gauderio]|uniref:uncharacterized protein obi1 n=1 Tax=Brachyhypopomus gauderio TaxID=698409 RepID=UPI0040417F14
MSQSFQHVTLSLTLPISCQICLGKVRRPMICGNNHVFCFTCIEVWLKRASQCPTCRVPITPENPCREILGATNDSESNESYSVKQRLRKTRGELLLREYEDEMEILLKENEELKTKNLSLEAQLNTALEPSLMQGAQSESPVDHSLLEESANKLRAANEMCRKLKQDMEKLKEANKTLRSQNVDLVQGNMRLKVEVENRSPQKFGRYTVAALEAKVLQYERELNRLKRALERSDTYIEELEAQVADGQKGGAPPAHGAQWSGSAPGERPGETRATTQHSRIATMRRSLSEIEEPSVCTNLDRISTRVGVPDGYGLLLTTSGVHHGRGLLYSAASPGDTELPNFSDPSTPSSSLSSLSLRSPVRLSQARQDSPCLPHLRRLWFEDCSTTSSQISRDVPFTHGGLMKPAKETVGGGQRSETSPCGREIGPVFRLRARGAVTAGHAEDNMDAAYRDKVSELDSMIADSESFISQTTQLSPELQHVPDFSVLLTADVEAGSDLLTAPSTVTVKQATPTACETSHAPFRILERDAGCGSTVAAKKGESLAESRKEGESLAESRKEGESLAESRKEGESLAESRKEGESLAESKKRKCVVSLATCSPSKLAKINT